MKPRRDQEIVKIELTIKKTKKPVQNSVSHTEIVLQTEEKQQRNSKKHSTQKSNIISKQPSAHSSQNWLIVTFLKYLVYSCASH